jgi:hypothetical protein
MRTRRNNLVSRKEPRLLDILYNIFIYYILCSQNTRERGAESGCSPVPVRDRQLGTRRTPTSEKARIGADFLNAVHTFAFPPQGTEGTDENTGNREKVQP